MNPEKKRKLLEEYKNRKPDMGVYMFKSINTGTVYLGCDKDIKATINGDRFKLKANGHMNKKFQNDWNKNKEENFIIEVVELLEYDKDGLKVDYSEDLQTLLEMCKERFENVEEIKNWRR